jgi:hypothetical protein
MEKFNYTVEVNFSGEARVLYAYASDDSSAIREAMYNYGISGFGHGVATVTRENSCAAIQYSIHC